jgi:EAL domain-containing protein (putative c-di-GMP-specific phosphodiesterase class I)/GGDEF domain-containing protein
MTRGQTIFIASAMFFVVCLAILAHAAILYVILLEVLLAIALFFLAMQERIQLAHLSSLISKMLVESDGGFDINVESLRLACMHGKYRALSNNICAAMDLIEQRHAKALESAKDFKRELDRLSLVATDGDCEKEDEIITIISELIDDSQKNRFTFAVMIVRVVVFDDVKFDMYLDNGLISKLVLNNLKKVSNDNFLMSVGRDEFIVALRESGIMKARQIANQMIHIVTTAIALNDKKRRCKVSIGIAVYPGHGTTTESVIKNAECALRLIEITDESGFQFYQEEISKEKSKTFSIKNELFDAFERKQFYLEFQPQINLSTGFICGAEALVRWRHPTGGVIPPIDFISEAEESGLILQLGQWVMESACETAFEWCKNGYFISVGVNVSVIQLMNPSFVDMVSTILHKTGLPNFMLDIEITESIMMIDQKKTVEVMNKIRSIGVGLSIDDFGTGFSSLSYITSMPASQIKIDRSFIVDESQKSSSVIEAIVHIGESAGIDVIAEGIETSEQSDRVKKVGCHKAQGYLYAKPMSAEKMMIFLKNQ